MDPDLLWTALSGVVPPLVVALVATVVARRGASPDGAPGRRALGGVAAVSLGYLAGHIASLGMPDVPRWGDANQGVAYVALAFGALGAVEALAGLPALARHLARGGLAWAASWFLLDFVRAYDWSGTEAVAITAAFGCALAAASAVLEPAAIDERGPALAGGTAIGIALTAGALALSHSASTGQLAGALAAAVGGVALVSLRPGFAALAGGALAPLLGVLLALILTGMYAADLPRAAAPFLFLTPLGARFGAGLDADGKHRWRGVLGAVGGASVVGGIGIAIAYLAATGDDYGGYGDYGY